MIAIAAMAVAKMTSSLIELIPARLVSSESPVCDSDKTREPRDFAPRPTALVARGPEMP
jgi:hypothetical protein